MRELTAQDDDIDEVLRAVDEYVQHDEAEKYHQEQKRKLGALIATSLEVGDERRVDGKGVKLIAGKRQFNARLAAQKLPEALFDMIATRSADPDLAKRYLPEEWLIACQTVGDPYLRRVG